jgi:hypothetical protein
MEVIKPNTLSTTDGSFTRASSGTYVNSTGYVNTASTNVPRFNYNPTTLLYEGLMIEPAKTNLLLYSNNFENTNWTKPVPNIAIPDSEDVLSPDGSLSCEKLIEGITNSQFYITQSKSVSVNTIYTSSIYVKADERSFVKLRFDDNASNVATCTFNLTTGTFAAPSNQGTVTTVIPTMQACNNGWYRISITCTFSIAPTTVVMRVFLLNDLGADTYLGDGVSGIYIWGAQVETGTYGLSSYIQSTDTFTSRASVGTYINSSGLVATATTNTARYSYNPNYLAAPPYLLLEAAATNLFTYSEQFDNANWTKTGSTIALNATTAPDGTLTAEKLNETTSASSQYIAYQLYTATAADYCISVYAKAAERSWLHLRFDTDAPVIGAWYNLSSGTLGSVGTGVVATIQNMGNGWYRCTYERKATAVSHYAVIGVSNNNSAQIYAGTAGSGIYIWGAQLELGTYPTSYYLTTTAAATRAADVSASVAATRAVDTVTGSGLIYSTVTDPNAVYSSGTTYALAAKVRYLSRVYESLQATNLNHTPSTSPTWWLDTGPDNIHAALDDAVSTVSSATTEMTFVVKAGKLDAVALITVDAPLASVAVTDQLTGALIYNQTAGLSGANVQDWYQYFFFDPITQRTQLVFDAIPDTYANAVVTIKLTGASGVPVSLAQAVFGITTQIGTTQYGASAGIIDYSKKETDAFGTTTFVVRAFSKRLSSEVFIPNTQLNSIQTYLYSIRATPVVWVASNDPLFSEPLIVWGFYKDFSTNISYPSYSVCSIEVEGLT